MHAFLDRERWNIDAERSSLTFSVSHAVWGQIRGRFHCWGGHIIVDPRAQSQASVHVWVDLSSVDTGSATRNKVILNTDPFDMGWEPGLVFDGDRLDKRDDGQVILTGWLDLRAFRQEISIAVDTISPPRVGEETADIVATARASIDRRAFGMRGERRVSDWLSEKLVGNTIEMTAQIVAKLAADVPLATQPRRAAINPPTRLGFARPVAAISAARTPAA